MDSIKVEVVEKMESANCYVKLEPDEQEYFAEVKPPFPVIFKDEVILEMYL